jgi:malonyl-CoA O-methyltransferase
MIISDIEHYKKAIQWIDSYTVNKSGIAVGSNQPDTIYPEVSGYFIPTIIKFGFRELAKKFGDYLLSIQREDGAWNAPKSNQAYTFDTGQILKGLYALIENFEDKNEIYKKSFLKGADWLLAQQRDDGSIGTPDKSSWVMPNGKIIPEAVHLYCLEPIKKVGEKYKIQKYIDMVQKALRFYLNKNNLTEFNTLSHFHAYIVEALIDLGEMDCARKAMQDIDLLRNEDGAVPAYADTKFVCSTGLFQYAICYYKLGEYVKGNKAFEYMKNLQNESGGWYGSYGENADYFPQIEISWAVKYFLDAIYYGQKTMYEQMAHIFLDEIDADDERYSLIESELNNADYKDILDVGCGKARYTKKLINKFPDKNFICVDLSKKVMGYIQLEVKKCEGSILNIPYKNETFNFVFVTEALEHAIDIRNAIREISRILKPNGKVVIIDKDIMAISKLKLAPFEQWFDVEELQMIMKDNGLKTTVKKNLKYENGRQNGLFVAWIGTKSDDEGFKCKN